MHNKNKITKQCWRTFAQMKNSLPIDNKLPNQFWAEAMDIANYLQDRLQTRCIADKTIIISKDA